MNELDFVLNKIKQIDNKTIELQTRTEQLTKEQETLLNKGIKNLEEKLIDDSNTLLEKEINAKVAEAQQVAKTIKEEAKKQNERIKKRYLEIKDPLIKQLCNEIIEIN